MSGSAETAAREMGGLSLADALRLCELMAQNAPARYERAALRWLQRFIDERCHHCPRLRLPLLRLPSFVKASVGCALAGHPWMPPGLCRDPNPGPRTPRDQLKPRWTQAGGASQLDLRENERLRNHARRSSRSGDARTPSRRSSVTGPLRRYAAQGLCCAAKSSLQNESESPWGYLSDLPLLRIGPSSRGGRQPCASCSL